MPRIQSLRPNVTQAEAVLQFTSAGATGLWRNLRQGPLRSVADFYIPFRLFHVNIQNRGGEERRILALDAVSGLLDPFHFEQLPASQDTIALETRNALPIQLAEAPARDLLIHKVQRTLFSKGFFRIRNLSISAQPAAEVHIPYWVGFRGRNGRARIAMIDAIRRREEGMKVRDMLQHWLASSEGESSTRHG
ncbi:MAG: hypothetical protein JST79_14445 [Acidobacteria bacterium]|nr:hypothetical protein [Acidobacteriota bacterium]